MTQAEVDALLLQLDEIRACTHSYDLRTVSTNAAALIREQQSALAAAQARIAELERLNSVAFDNGYGMGRRSLEPKE